jgi:hypothetical protein
MVFKLLGHKWHKVTIVVSLIFISLILILSLLVNAYWSPILAGEVKDVVLTSSDSLYNIDFSSAELHVLRGTIVFNNITLKPDTAVYNRKKEQHLAPNNLVELHIKRLTLSHIHPFTLYFHNKLDIGKIILNEPELNVTYQLNHTKDTVLKDNRTPWQKISKSLRSIHVGSIILGDVKLRYEDYSGHKLAISELKEMNLSATNLLIDSATQTDKSRLLYCKDIVAELNNYKGISPNGLYAYKFKHLKLSTQKSQLNIEGLTLKPINATDFFNKSHRDRFNMVLDSLQLNNFDFFNYHKYRILTTSSMFLNKGTVEITSNPNHPVDKTDKVTSFPKIGLYKINADMRIDTAILHHVNVIYSEYNSKSNQTGSISFNNTSGRVLNITTNQAALQKNNISSAQLTTYFMNRGKLDLNFVFNLTDENNSFSYKGHLGQMDLKVINTATMPLTMVKVTSGTVKQMDFDIHANQEKANGRITILYNDLKVILLKPDTVFDDLKRNTLESLYANLFILKHNNPDAAGEQPRSFYVNYNRSPETPFFKFIWQTLLSGIKPTIGLNEKEREATSALISELKTDKQNHLIKKEQRIKRREARRQKRAEKKLEQGG